MKNVIRFFIILLLGLYLQAEAGLVNSAAKGGRELVEQGVRALLKKAVKEGAEELSETAAKKTVREMVQHSDDIARLAREFGEDALVRIIKTPQARRLCEEGGEHAALAIIRHGDQAIELLSKTPKDSFRGVAAALSGMEKPAARRMTGIIRNMGDNAEEALKWVGRHPRLATTIAATGIIAGLLLPHPEALNILEYLYRCAVEHPYLCAVALLVSVGLIWFLCAIYVPRLIRKLCKRLIAKTTK